MKKSGIINAELMKALTLARHGHMITICDAGFPIPKGEDIIDLSLTAGIPSFFDTLKAVLNEIIVENSLWLTIWKFTIRRVYNRFKK